LIFIKTPFFLFCFCFRPKLSQLECIKAKIICEVETFLKEQCTSEESEKEIEILRLEKKLHEQAIADLDKDIRQVGKGFYFVF